MNLPPPEFNDELTQIVILTKLVNEMKQTTAIAMPVIGSADGPLVIPDGEAPDPTKEILDKIKELRENYSKTFSLVNKSVDDKTDSRVLVHLNNRTVEYQDLPGMETVEINEGFILRILTKSLDHLFEHDDAGPLTTTITVPVKTALQVEINADVQHTCRFFTPSIETPTAVSEANVAVAEDYPFNIFHPLTDTCVNKSVIAQDEDGSNLFTACILDGLSSALHASCDFYEPEPIVENSLIITFKRGDEVIVTTCDTSRMGLGVPVIFISEGLRDLIKIHEEKFWSIAEILGIRIDAFLEREVLVSDCQTYETNDNLYSLIQQYFKGISSVVSSEYQLINVSSETPSEKGTFIESIRPLSRDSVAT